MEPLYRLFELSTTGWEEYDKHAPSMTKEDCQELYRELLGDGMSPDYLRIKRVS